MVTTVSLNPSIDRTVSVGQFTYGGMNRVKTARNDPAGKALNVALTCAELGLASECIGFNYEENGRMLESRLLLHGVKTDFLWDEGRVRTNIKLLDEATGAVTEINEAGQAVSTEKIALMTDLVADHVQESDFLVLTGSLPPQCPVDYYRTLIETSEGLPCRCVLDAEGDVLKNGIAAHPFLVKPNLHEAELLWEKRIESDEDAYNAADAFRMMGAENVVISMGREGAVFSDANGIWRASAVDVEVRSTVGAGDAMVAGLMAGFLQEKDEEDILRMGVACASASIMTEGTQIMQKTVYRELLPLVQIRRIV